MEKSFNSVKLANLPEVARYLISLLNQEKVVCFYGHMGAGKTTFINLLAKEMGIVGDTSSPTYSLVNEYITAKNEIIYHFDFYRLKSEEEAYDMGYEDYLYSGNVCLIEWPERIAGLIPQKAIRFEISGVGETRDIKIETTW